ANPDLSQEETEELSKKIMDFITSETGIIIKSRKSEKRRLGCPVKEKNEGFLISAEFSIEPKKIKDLKKLLGEEQNILRHMLVIKPGEEKEEKPLDSVRETKLKKVEIENIDEKIDEILK
ncbi:MAG: 30S ribosomal protein S6, partial [bacterium]|nr:30S ribosomal protein S6 [bacterium]